MVADLDMAFSPLLPELTASLPRAPETQVSIVPEEDESWRDEIRKLRRRQDDMMTVTMIVVVVLCLLNAAHVVYATRRR